MFKAKIHSGMFQTVRYYYCVFFCSAQNIIFVCVKNKKFFLRTNSTTKKTDHTVPYRTVPYRILALNIVVT